MFDVFPLTQNKVSEVIFYATTKLVMIAYYRGGVLENWPVLGSRTALLFGKLKICVAVKKFFVKRFLVEIA